MAPGADEGSGQIRESSGRDEGRRGRRVPQSEQTGETELEPFETSQAEAEQDEVEQHGRELLHAHETSWALWEVLRTAEEAQHAVARTLGLPTTDAVALDHVVRTNEPIGPGELARRLDISTASATVLVDRLVASGHVVRQSDPRDGRRRVLVATDQARQQAVDAMTPLLVMVDAIADELTPEAIETVVHYLRRVATVHRDYIDHTRER